MRTFTATVMMAVLFIATGPVQAGRALAHSGQAITESARAAGYSMVGTTHLVAGVVAVPFKVTGAAAGVGNGVGDALWEEANAPIGAAPLPIADEAVTAGPPPAEALFKEEKRP